MSRSRETYYDTIEEQQGELTEELDRIQQKKSDLRRLDRLVSKIDCDVGGATINQTGSVTPGDDGVQLQVTMTVPNIGRHTKRVIEDFDWSHEEIESREMDGEEEMFFRIKLRMDF